jgi:hypothetical protein
MHVQYVVLYMHYIYIVYGSILYKRTHQYCTLYIVMSPSSR